MKVNDQDVFAEYTTFRIEAESDKYVFIFVLFFPLKLNLRKNYISPNFFLNEPFLETLLYVVNILLDLFIEKTRTERESVDTSNSNKLPFF